MNINFRHPTNILLSNSALEQTLSFKILFFQILFYLPHNNSIIIEMCALSTRFFRNVTQNCSWKAIFKLSRVIYPLWTACLIPPQGYSSIRSPFKCWQVSARNAQKRANTGVECLTESKPTIRAVWNCYPVRERKGERERVEFHPQIGIFTRRGNLDAQVSEYQVLESVETTRETAVWNGIFTRN